MFIVSHMSGVSVSHMSGVWMVESHNSHPALHHTNCHFQIQFSDMQYSSHQVVESIYWYIIHTSIPRYGVYYFSTPKRMLVLQSLLIQNLHYFLFGPVLPISRTFHKHISCWYTHNSRWTHSERKKQQALNNITSLIKPQEDSSDGLRILSLVWNVPTCLACL